MNFTELLSIHRLNELLNNYDIKLNGVKIECDIEMDSIELNGVKIECDIELDENESEHKIKNFSMSK